MQYSLLFQRGLRDEKIIRMDVSVFLFRAIACSRSSPSIGSDRSIDYDRLCGDGCSHLQLSFGEIRKSAGPDEGPIEAIGD